MRFAAEAISQQYGDLAVLEDVSFSAETGEVVALLGPNGSGKSTLIKTVCDLLPPASGRVTVDGEGLSNIPPTERAKIIGYVPQSFQFASFTTVLDTVLVGRRPYMQWSYSDQDLDIARKALRTMNITDLRARYVNELSGGQRQRVFIARALAQHPKFYFFDEPTSSLDLRHQLRTMKIMRELVRKEECGMVLATHDLNLVLRYADKVLVLKDRRVHSFGRPEEVLTSEAIQEVYGVEACVVRNERGLFVLPYDPSEEVPGMD